MSELTNIFSNIANSIRNVTGSSDLIYPNNMANVINNMSGSGNTIHISPQLQNIWNVPVVIDNGITYLNQTFYGCTYFNQPVTFPDSIIYDMKEVFSGCIYFNQPVTLPNNVGGIENLFEKCYNFNQAVVIPDSIRYMQGAFRNCYIFNQSVHISNNSHAYLDNLFDNCHIFNYPVTIPNSSSVWSLRYMFSHCYRFNQRFIVPESILNMDGFLYHCTNFNSSIYFLGNTLRTLNTNNLLAEGNNSLIKKLYFNSALNIRFNKSTSDTTIVGSTIYWTTIDSNSYYNAAYNIYCYTNFSGLAQDVPA